MTEVMRFTIRCDGTVVLGKMLGETPGLKPGYVYSVREVLGELLIVEEGKSCLALATKDSAGTHTCWAHDIGRIVTSGDHLLTVEESLERMKRRSNENG